MAAVDGAGDADLLGRLTREYLGGVAVRTASFSLESVANHLAASEVVAKVQHLDVQTGLPAPYTRSGENSATSHTGISALDCCPSPTESTAHTVVGQSLAQGIRIQWTRGWRTL